MLTDVVISAKSANVKTGPMPTISRPIESTCPTTCRLAPRALGGDGSCYAAGRINGTVRKYAADMTVDQAVARLKPATTAKALAGNRHRLIRDRVVGDIIAPGTARDAATERADVGYLLDVAAVAAKSVGPDGRPMVAYGYTHAFDLLTADDVQRVAESGYVLNASVDSVEGVAGLERAVALGMPTTYAGDDLADGDIVAGRRVVTCPAQVRPGESAPRVASCSDCGLCGKAQRAVTVRFLMH